MEITYYWEGDYLIPALALSDTTEYHIGKYGRMGQRFLKENHRGIYSHMLLSIAALSDCIAEKQLLLDVDMPDKVMCYLEYKVIINYVQ